MADQETSHIMWIAMVTAIAGMLLVMFKPALADFASSAFGKGNEIASGIVVSSSSNPGTDENLPVRPNNTDPKWVNSGPYGTNGEYVLDADGKMIVYAIDKTQPITLTTPESVTQYKSDLKELYFIDPVVATGYMSGALSGLDHLEKLGGMSNWDVSGATNISGFFNMLGRFTTDGIALTGISNWDVSKQTDLSRMFANSKITSVDVSNWDTSSATDMSYMFNEMSLIKSVDVSNFDTSNVTTFSYMFKHMASVTSINISNFDFSKVTANANVDEMFTTNDSVLTTLKTDNVTKIPAGAKIYMSNFGAGLSTSMQTVLTDKVITTVVN